MQYIHPFPARMAPKLALDSLTNLKCGSLILDPMSGSGTVLREASLAGHRAIGFDMDPLAVLMSKVSNTPIDVDQMEDAADYALMQAKSLSIKKLHLPWIDEDLETENFINYWFAQTQIDPLRRLAYIFYENDYFRKNAVIANALQLAMSRLIITKMRGASLARDVSHSRPHKYTDINDFDVLKEFKKSILQLKKRLGENAPKPGVKAELGDARALKKIKEKIVDAVISSPPYLNAIDYLRGHKFSLVWFGFKIGDIRLIRSASIGAEKAPEKNVNLNNKESLLEAFGNIHLLPSRYRRMIERYAMDLFYMLSEVSRVLKPKGKAVFVIGNSCLRGVFIQNSDALIKAAEFTGFKLKDLKERDLPVESRYLPMPESQKSSLGRRMRSECILTFESL
jgi:SAM-dependent methyltransferase